MLTVLCTLNVSYVLYSFSRSNADAYRFMFVLRRDIVVHGQKDKRNDGPASLVSNFWRGAL